MQAKLTKRTVDAAKPGIADEFLWDTELKGFGLKVTPRGRRVFVVQYWSPKIRGSRRRMTLAAFGILTVEQAREMAQRLLGRVANGEDPGADASAGRRASREQTVAVVGAEYLADIDAKVKPRTSHEYTRLFASYIVPAIGNRVVAEVTLRDVAAIHTAKKKNPYQANRILNLMAAFLNWAEKRGYRPRNSNPCRDVTKYPEKSRERFLSVEEIGRLGAALQTAETVGLSPAPHLRRKPGAPEKAKHRPKTADKPIPANPLAVAAIRFLILTGWREQEALTLRWADLDLDRAIATLSETKTGKSHRQIGLPAMAVLASLPRLSGSPYVFPGAKPQAPLREIKRLWSAARLAAGLEGVRLHDLRHTAASFSVGGGTSLYLTGKLLGHSRSESTQRYAHLSDDARRLAADSMAESLAAALAGRPAATVTPITSTRALRRRPK